MEKTSLGKALGSYFAEILGRSIQETFVPVFAFVEEEQGIWQAIVENQMDFIMPLYHFGAKGEDDVTGGKLSIEDILREEGREEMPQEEGQEAFPGENGEEASRENDRDEAFLEEGPNEALREDETGEDTQDSIFNILALFEAENDLAKNQMQDGASQGAAASDGASTGDAGPGSTVGGASADTASGDDSGTVVPPGETTETDSGADAGAEGDVDDLSASAAGGVLGNLSGTGFVPHTEKLAEVDLNGLRDYETLVQTFYTVDSSTMIGSDQLNVETLAGKDLSIDKNAEGPQILIYHTHSQEAFADSVKGDRATSIVGVGDYLTRILTEQYGYQVLHHDGTYDVPSRDDAYSVALPAIEKLLEENPTIQVVIDLHRDAMDEKTHLVTEIDGRPTARFMFFNGLSRTRKTGNISYLYNENLDDNLAFSFQLQRKAMEYYPGLTRRIYLKAYRYNMHLRPRNLLIELGAQNNTVEEAMNACDPIAHILDMVLSGEG